MVSADDGGRIGVVASDGDFDVIFIDHTVIGWIDPNPTVLRKVDFYPCVGGVDAPGFQGIIFPVPEVTADVTGRHFVRAADSKHDVGKILANALFLLEHFDHVGLGVGDVWRIGELVENHVFDRKDPIPYVIMFDPEILPSSPDLGGDGDVPAALQKIVQLGISFQGGEFGEGDRAVRAEVCVSESQNFGDSFNFKSVMGICDVKVVYVIEIEIKMFMNLNFWSDF